MDRMKKDACEIGILLLVGQVFFYGITIIVICFFLLGGNMEIGQMVGADLRSLVANGVLMGIFWLIKSKRTVPMKKTGGLLFGDKEVKRVTSSRYIVVMAVSVLLWNTVISMLDHVTNHIFSVPMESNDEIPLITAVLFMAVFPALIEEFAFRKVIYGLMRQHGVFVATAFSSIMFGLMHQNIIQIVFAIGLGIICCLVYEKTGQLRWAVFIHFLNNLISVICSYISFYRNYGNVIEIITGVAGVIYFIWIWKYKEKWVEKKNIKDYNWRELACCLTRIPVFIFMVLCIGISIVTIWR